MKTKIIDERITSESNKIYKLCYYILCIGVFLDLMIKINLWDFSSSITIYDKFGGLISNENKYMYFFINICFEAFFLLVSIFTNIILLVKKGISFGINDYDSDTFPKKYYAKISLIISAIITISSFVVRIVIYTINGADSSPYILLEYIIVVVLIIVAFILLFLFFFMIFYLTFRAAKKIRNNNFD
jgi:hypothetical protein